MKMSHIEDPVKEAGFTESRGSLEKPDFSKAGTQRTATALRPTDFLYTTKLCQQLCQLRHSGHRTSRDHVCQALIGRFLEGKHGEGPCYTIKVENF